MTPDAEAVNGGAVPHIDDVWAGVVKAECKVALQSAKQVYMDAMAAVRERLPQEEEVCGYVAVSMGAWARRHHVVLDLWQDLDRLHNDARSAALQVFATVALGANASELKQQLKASMRDEAAAVAKENRKASKATCKFLLEVSVCLCVCVGPAPTEWPWLALYAQPLRIFERMTRGLRTSKNTFSTGKRCATPTLAAFPYAG